MYNHSYNCNRDLTCWLVKTKIDESIYVNNSSNFNENKLSGYSNGKRAVCPVLFRIMNIRASSLFVAARTLKMHY